MMIIKWSEDLLRVVASWCKDNIIFRKAAFFIFGLIFSHALVEYALVSVLMTHLTVDWNLLLPKAAQIVNAQDGFSAVLVVFVAHVSDAYLGHFKMIALATSAYGIGLMVLFVAAWKLRSIEDKILYGALVLLAVGKAGRDISLKAILADQLRPRSSEDDTNEVEICWKVWWRFWWFLGIILATIVFSTSSWKSLSLTSTIAIWVGFLIFLLGFRFYNYREPTGSWLSTLFRVFRIAKAKRHLSYAVSSSQLYQNESGHTLILPAIPLFRWLDKAAIIESSLISVEEQVSEGRLCTVTQVKEVKLLFTMIPMWTTFLVYSLVAATGNTFFFVQFDSMDSHVGSIKEVPVIVFLVIMNFTKFTVSYLCDLLLPKLQFLKNQKQIKIVKIGLGMLSSVLCCIIAWKIEAYRKTSDTWLSVFWLTPQFILLGFMEGFAEGGLDDFVEMQFSESMRMYGPRLNEFVGGIGKFISVIFILIFRGWFGEDIDSSHFELYYITLAALSVANTLVFGYIGYRYGYEQVGAQTDDEAEMKLEDGVEALVDEAQMIQSKPEKQDYQNMIKLEDEVEALVDKAQMIQSKPGEQDYQNMVKESEMTKLGHERN